MSLNKFGNYACRSSKGRCTLDVRTEGGKEGAKEDEVREVG